MQLRQTICFCLLSLAGWLWPFCSTPVLAASEQAEVLMRLVEEPHVSPDGKQIVFSWIGEIWTSTIDGGNLRRLTAHPARDRQPHFSPDGEQIAFTSTRTGSSQLWVMRADGTALRQLTFHSEGYSLEDWFPDGKSLLATGVRDHFHRDATRLIKVSLTRRVAEEVLVDAMAEDAHLSPDGQKILFTREGERWWRKGYQGERSAQVWLYDIASGQFSELLHEGTECMWPQWMADGKGFYFTKGTNKGFDLWRYRFPKNEGKPPKRKRVASFEEDSIVYPAISRDGSTIVFRHLVDLYSLDLTDKKSLPQKIELQISSDIDLPDDEMRREFSDASEVSFTQDGLEIALVAGGDIWVMDTKLREPKRVTESAGFESDIVFSPDGEAVWFTTTVDGQTDIWTARRADSDRYWWQNDQFELTQITRDRHVESGLQFTPDGKQLLFQRGRGELFAMDLASQETRRLVSGFSRVDFDISPDGRWITYAKQDDNFNSDIWIQSLADGVKANVSRHPDNDQRPVFSPDGKLLAFTGRQSEDEVDIYYVYLQAAQGQRTSRQRTLEEALELMRKKRKSNEKRSSDKTGGSEKSAEDAKQNDETGQGRAAAEQEDEEGQSAEGPEPIEIDLDKIHQRVKRLSIPNSYESSLLFSPEGDKLAFSARIDGESGLYTVEFPDKLTPKLLSTSTGSQAVWSKAAGGILYLRSGSPAKLDSGGKVENYRFSVAQTASRSGWLKAGFEKAWLSMREIWYDKRFANRNWDDIRRKYADIAGQTYDTSGLAEVIQLMLGELNGSHLGFYPSSPNRDPSPEGWRQQTAHLGVRFDVDFMGPGLKVRDVLPDGPADRVASRLYPGDVITAIDGVAVDPAMDLTEVLNGRLDRDIVLAISRPQQAAEDEGDQPAAEELNVTLRPISYAAARSALYRKWLEENRAKVDALSEGRLGYLHIRAMNRSSFLDFERQLYNVGYGREGLVIDVRDNGGGSTTDLLLTALTQPRHAITVPRGGGQGYPQDRAVFATWSKPIIVLCNQNSYSNAEIFSHAIKTLQRGKVVGVRTAGGVVSTGSARVNDVGTIRAPFRGWFVIGTGEDMEMNGCIPDKVVWPKPGELPQGTDRQLKHAIRMLLEEVGDGEPERTLTYATERKQSN